MAEGTQDLEAQLAAGMARWLAYVQDYHIDEWRDDRYRIMDAAQNQWQELSKRDTPTSYEHQANLHDFVSGLERFHERRAHEAVAIPDGAHLNFYAWEAEREREARYEEPDPGDPEYLGWQA